MSCHGLSFLAELNRPALIGMIHVGALPGTPRSKQSVAALAKQAVAEAAVLIEGGVDAIALENMHDVPYLNRTVGPEIVAAMTAVCAAVRGRTGMGVAAIIGITLDNLIPGTNEERGISILPHEGAHAAEGVDANE